MFRIAQHDRKMRASRLRSDKKLDFYSEIPIISVFIVAL